MVRLHQVTLSLALASVATATEACFSLLLETIASYFSLGLEITHWCLTAGKLIEQLNSDSPARLVHLVDWAYNMLAPALW